MNKGLPLIKPRISKILILGTFPGRISLAKKQYYAHPRNQFWELLFTSLGERTPETYKDKTDAAKKLGIALCDTIGSCSRHTSADTAIKNPKPNKEVMAFLKANRSIAVFTTSKTAQKFFDSLFVHGQKAVCLPSPSPAYASKTFEEKLRIWKLLLKPALR